MENTEMMCPLKWDFWMLWEMTEGKEKQKNMVTSIMYIWLTLYSEKNCYA